MRNKFPGVCYRCNERVEAGDGHFERFRNGWRTQHATCAIEHRGTPDPEREADKQRLLQWRAANATGKQGQRARQKLKRVTEVQG